MSCLRVSDVLDMSHDSVNRFLYRETYSPEDLFAEASKCLDLIDGILSVDDTVSLNGNTLTTSVTKSFVVIYPLSISV